MKKSIKTAVFACIFAAAFQITAFAGFTWRVESADSSYVGTTNVTVTNTSGKKDGGCADREERGCGDFDGGGGQRDIHREGL